jgi:flagellar motor switch protein FliN/FliY
MDENNGLDVDQENASLEEENISEDRSPDAAVLEKPAADSIAPEENAVEGETPGESSGEVSQDEQAALLNQEDIIDESDDDGEDSGSSGLLSQEEIDNAIEQGGAEDSENDQDVGGEDGMSQEEIDAAINAAVGELDVGDFSSTEKQPEVKEADFQQLSSSNTSGGQRNIDLLMDVELPVSIELGRTTMDISDILALGPGSVVELEKLVGEPVDLLVNNKCVARGEVVVVEENFGLRITSLISPEERIKNLQ